MEDSMKKSRFIVIEGGEGAGKGTQIALLKQWLKATNISYTTTREPGGTPFAEAIRSVLLSPEARDVDSLAMLLSFFAARVDHVQRIITPALERGELVICDRFDASTFAYQIYDRIASDSEMFWNLRQKVLDLLPCHPHYIVLDVEPAIGLDRVRARARRGGQPLTHFDSQGSVEHDRVRRGYRYFLAEARGSLAYINANRGVDEVFNDFLREVERVFLLQP